jgi:hypothetical protein
LFTFSTAPDLLPAKNAAFQPSVLSICDVPAFGIPAFGISPSYILRIDAASIAADNNNNDNGVGYNLNLASDIFF